MKRMAYDLFLSYSHRDAGIARHVASQFSDAGLKCFLAETDIGAGDVWEERVRSALKSSTRVLLLLTPYSRSSLWVAAEAGAAWALEKPLIAATMFVDPAELIDPIKRHQARAIETPQQLQALVNELAPAAKFLKDQIEGQWLDPRDNDIVYFLQRGPRVLGFYDYGSSKGKVGLYRGEIADGVLTYQWEWLNGQFSGRGEMRLSSDSNTLSGEWYYAGRKQQAEEVLYRRVSKDMPDWLSEEDFRPYLEYFSDGDALHSSGEHKA